MSKLHRLLQPQDPDLFFDDCLKMVRGRWSHRAAAVTFWRDFSKEREEVTTKGYDPYSINNARLRISRSRVEYHINV